MHVLREGHETLGRARDGVARSFVVGSLVLLHLTAATVRAQGGSTHTIGAHRTLLDHTRLAAAAAVEAGRPLHRCDVLPDLFVDGLIGIGLFGVADCNERRLPHLLRAGFGANRLSGRTAPGPDAAARCGEAYTPVWGGRGDAVEQAFVRLWLQAGPAAKATLDAVEVRDLDAVAASLWGRHAGMFVGYSPIGGGLSDEAFAVRQWQACRAGREHGGVLDGGVFGQCLWRGLELEPAGEFAERLVRLLRSPRRLVVSPASGPLLLGVRLENQVPGVRIVGEAASWRALRSSAVHLRQAIGTLRGAEARREGLSRDVLLFAGCVAWLDRAIAALAIVENSLAAGRRDLVGDEVAAFWRALQPPPVSLFDYRHAADGWGIGHAVRVVDGVLEARFAVETVAVAGGDAVPWEAWQVHPTAGGHDLRDLRVSGATRARLELRAQRSGDVVAHVDYETPFATQSVDLTGSKVVPGERYYVAGAGLRESAIFTLQRRVGKALGAFDVQLELSPGQQPFPGSMALPVRCRVVARDAGPTIGPSALDGDPFDGTSITVLARLHSHEPDAIALGNGVRLLQPNCVASAPVAADATVQLGIDDTAAPGSSVLWLQVAVHKGPTVLALSPCLGWDVVAGDTERRRRDADRWSRPVPVVGAARVADGPMAQRFTTLLAGAMQLEADARPR
jgi:hypothetical protein